MHLAADPGDPKPQNRVVLRFVAVSPPTRPEQLPRRQLPIVGFIAVAIVYLVVIKVVGIVAGDQTEVVDGRLLTTENVTWEMIVPLGAALIFVYTVISVLGWWSQVVHDPRPVRRWVWALPVIFAVAIIAGINYGGLADRGGSFTILLVIAALCVGFGEEGMFRCIGVTSLRQHGLTEGKVVFWSSLIFGLVHLTNLIGGNEGAIGQAIAVSFAGYFFYLIRRVSRSNILNSILHGWLRLHDPVRDGDHPRGRRPPSGRRPRRTRLRHLWCPRRRQAAPHRTRDDVSRRGPLTPIGVCAGPRVPPARSRHPHRRRPGPSADEERRMPGRGAARKPRSRTDHPD